MRNLADAWCQLLSALGVWCVFVYCNCYITYGEIVLIHELLMMPSNIAAIAKLFYSLLQADCQSLKITDGKLSRLAFIYWWHGDHVGWPRENISKRARHFRNTRTLKTNMDMKFGRNLRVKQQTHKNKHFNTSETWKSNNENDIS